MKIIKFKECNVIYAEDQPENVSEPIRELAKIGDKIIHAILDTVESENAPLEPKNAPAESKDVELNSSAA